MTEPQELAFHGKPVTDMTRDELIAALHEAAKIIENLNCHRDLSIELEKRARRWGIGIDRKD